MNRKSSSHSSKSSSSSCNCSKHTNCPDEPLEIGANCIVKIGGCFFLLVEIESEVQGVEIEAIVAIRISEEDANKLMKCGVKQCKVEDKEPKHAEFRCILTIDGKVFRVFEIEDCKEEFVLVKSTTCNIVQTECNSCM